MQFVNILLFRENKKTWGFFLLLFFHRFFGFDINTKHNASKITTNAGNLKRSINSSVDLRLSSLATFQNDILMFYIN